MAVANKVYFDILCPHALENPSYVIIVKFTIANLLDFVIIKWCRACAASGSVSTIVWRDSKLSLD